MFAQERHLRIVEMVNRLGKATVAELSEALKVSSVTIRRDLEKLEEQQELVRTHGGAMARQLGQAGAWEQSFWEKQKAFAPEKERIAEAAASLVGDEEAVLLTPGTTNTILAQKLCVKKHLTLVTNAANIAMQIAPQSDVDVVLLGGKLRTRSFAMVGPLAEDNLRKIRVDKLFLGVDGFDFEHGLTTPNLSEAGMERLMIPIAKQVIVVADHSKFGKVAFSHIAGVDAVHTVVTDDKLDESYRRKIKEAGIRLLIV